MPAGLRGTIEEVLQGESAGALAAVLLSATGPDVTDGLFLVSAGTTTPLVTTTPTDSTRLRSFVMNASGDVAYHARIGTSATIRARPHGAGADVTLVDPGRA